MDATKWTQGFQEITNVKPMEQIIPDNTAQHTCTTSARPNGIIFNTNINAGSGGGGGGGSGNGAASAERKARPQEKLNCPRCNSTNTKFCYYNNYSLTQPRYFCKGCRRYWTEGGSLRNVPVGGSSRKNKRSSSSILKTPSSSSSLGLTSKLPDPNPPILFSGQNPNSTSITQPKGSSQDLNLLSFPVMQDGHHHHHHYNMSQFLQMPKIESITQQNPSSSSPSLYVSSSPVSALELLRTGVSSRGFNAFMPGSMIDSNAVLYSSSGFPIMADYKPNKNLLFAGEIGHNSSGNNRSDEENENINGSGRVLFPFAEMKELSSTTTQEVDENDHQQKSQVNSSTNAYWSGMFSTTGGSSW